MTTLYKGNATHEYHTTRDNVPWHFVKVDGMWYELLCGYLHSLPVWIFPVHLDYYGKKG